MYLLWQIWSMSARFFCANNSHNDLIRATDSDSKYFKSLLYHVKFVYISAALKIVCKHSEHSLEESTTFSDYPWEGKELSLTRKKLSLRDSNLTSSTSKIQNNFFLSNELISFYLFIYLLIDITTSNPDPFHWMKKVDKLGPNVFFPFKLGPQVNCFRAEPEKDF